MIFDRKYLEMMGSNEKDHYRLDRIQLDNVFIMMVEIQSPRIITVIDGLLKPCKII